MRGACLCYQYSGNGELYKTLEETVIDLLSNQDKLGRFSTYTINKEFQSWDMWGRKYVLTALEHFYEICKDPLLKAQMLKAMKSHTDYIISKVGNKEGQIDIVVCLESMPSVSEESYLWTQQDVDVIEHILNKERNQTVMLTYSDNDGNITNLYMNTNFRAKRNIRYTMSFSLSDAIRNGGITATTVDEGNMTEEGFQF